MRHTIASLLLLLHIASAQTPRSISGIYPTLASFNNEGECGTGAVVPWADRLWVITYGPHRPTGSSDKLYEITPDMQMTVRPESIGGTPANRMIHPESQQLFIGPYAIDAKRNVRAIPYDKMFGRHTGLARHLSDPAGKIVFATMEEGIYEVDVKTLEVKNLWVDEQLQAGGANKKSTTQNMDGSAAKLPGYHGKGFYSSQGHYIYSNNGEHGDKALTNPFTPSGCLAEWNGAAKEWNIVRRNQFTEVTGPGGINGGTPKDPVWCIGWDAKSLILMLRDNNAWHTYRLPKVSHAYDGAHGWNTEWPRIRDIGTAEQPDYLMTMHGAFWRFPATFSAANPNGIRPRSAYLKVVGDFCRWNDRIVLGCDDAAKSEFLNTRKIKGGINSVGQSQSNLWFVAPDTLDQLGPAHASGAIWLHEKVTKNQRAEPFLIAGWKHRSLWLIDHQNGTTTRRDLTESEDWLHLTAPADSNDFSAFITLSNDDARTTTADPIFAGIATIDQTTPITGTFRARGENKRTLAYVNDDGYYELNAELQLQRIDDEAAAKYTRDAVALKKNLVTLDDASILITDNSKRRWRLPRATDKLDASITDGQLRICREVVTERDLLNLCGTFFELPAENADGFAKVRPISSHNLRITDFGSYRGLMLMSGISPTVAASNHILRSDDGKAALWAGTIDDLWKLGKPHGEGGPWKNSSVQAKQPSDSYLFWAYDQRSIQLSHDAKQQVAINIELDLTGTGLWVPYQTITVPAGESITRQFPAAIQARWLRVTSDTTCKATAWLKYQ